MSSATLLALVLAFGPVRAANPPPNPKVIQELIQKEKSRYNAQETVRLNLLQEIDELNRSQNTVRTKLGSMTVGQLELSMALENLAMEVDRQREMEQWQRQKLKDLIRWLYRMQKDGVVQYMIQGKSLSDASKRLRILIHSLKNQQTLNQELAKRSERLSDSESKLQSIQTQILTLLEELGQQENLLEKLLAKKESLITQLNQKQKSHQALIRQYQQVSKEVSIMFEKIESQRNEITSIFPRHGSLVAPIDTGKLLQSFGKVVDKKFKTVIFQKGVEIEAPHGTSVKAILPGIVEHEGWVRGMGNVIIIHHGGGFYSLSGHLFKMHRQKGDSVNQGDVIGEVGDTGNQDRPSLYFELREKEKAVDPIAYFRTSSRETLVQ